MVVVPSEVVPSVVVLERKKVMTCMDYVIVAFTPWSQSAPDNVKAKTGDVLTLFDTAVLISDHKLRDTRMATKPTTCRQCNQLVRHEWQKYPRLDRPSMLP